MSRTCIVVFHMPGCEACAEYLPRFARMAAPYNGRVPIYVIDANAPESQAWANRLDVQAVPVTFILRKPAGMIRREGGLPDDEIQELLATAYNHR